MVVVLRMQGLTNDAGSEDIRKFFNGLHIPDGGVLITGGKTGEAFIIFNTEKEGLLAMRKTGKLLKGVNIRLRVSSMNELKHKMEMRLKNQRSSAEEDKLERKHKPVPQTVASVDAGDDAVPCSVEENKPPSQSTSSVDVGTAVLQCLVAVIQGLQTNNQVNNCQAAPTSGNHVPDLPSPSQTTQVKEPTPSDFGQVSAKEMNSSNPGYVRLYRLPSTATEADIRQFLSDVSVLKVIKNVLIGHERCSLVKVASTEEAEASLKYNDKYLNDSCIKVRWACENMWKDGVKQREMERPTEPKPYHHSSHNRHLKDPSYIGSQKRHHTETRSSSDIPKRHCSEPQTLDTEYCVMVRNHPTPITKSEIKVHFSHSSLENDQIVHLLNKWRQQTPVTFIIYTQPEDYTFALNMNGTFFGSRKIEVTSITREKMKELMYKNQFVEHSIVGQNEDQSQSAWSCIYARNFPADVRNEQVKNLFCKYHITESDITLLHDTNGNGIGEAVVQFRSESSAKEAHSLHMTRFLGQQVLLTCITPRQMKDILHKPQKSVTARNTSHRNIPSSV